jgi:hypothetical protein
MSKQAPTDLLYDLACVAICYDKHGPYGKPGAVIERLSPEKREILKKLTSDEARKARPLFS